MKQIHRQGFALAECFPDVFLPSGSEKTILEFDKSYTAPAAGYKNVDDYYSKCSAKGYLENISVPTTILCSEDDPFIQKEIFKYWKTYIFRPIVGSGGLHFCTFTFKIWKNGSYNWLLFRNNAG